MTTQTPRPPSARDPEEVSAHLRRLEELVSAAKARNQKTRRTIFTVGLTITAVCFVSLSLLTLRTFELTAQALTDIGRAEIERQLPGGMNTLQDHLKAQAPSVIARAIDDAVDHLLPQARRSLVKKLDERTEEATLAFEEHLQEAMVTAVRATRAEIDRAGDAKTDNEKFELLVSHVADRFRKAFYTASQELYPHYSSEMGRIKAFLVDLQERDENELTEHQRLQKELIQTMLQILTREGVSDFPAARS